MAGNTFGKLFTITNWGESHGKALGVVIDGCPASIGLCEEDIQKELDRRAPGQSTITTKRAEKDQVKILSGVFEGITTGQPISLLIENNDQKSADYANLREIFRPGHADFTYFKRYGIRDFRGGGRSSARTTVGTVAAGAVANKVLMTRYRINITAYVKQVYNLTAEIENPLLVTREQVEQNPIRCPDQNMAEKMISLIKKVQTEGDSVGGIIECVVSGLPAGLGEPLFDKLSADLAKAVFTINAVRGFEIGEGFNAVYLTGSENNDIFINENKQIKTKTNHAGGVLGGISNGMPLIFKAAFKATPTIGKEQQTVDKQGNPVNFTAAGRHDPCVLPRAVPVVEAITACVILDHCLRLKAYKND